MVVVVLLSAMLFSTHVSALLLLAVVLAGYSMYLYNVDVTPVAAPSAPVAIYTPISQNADDQHEEVSLDIISDSSHRDLDQRAR